MCCHVGYRRWYRTRTLRVLLLISELFNEPLVLTRLSTRIKYNGFQTRLVTLDLVADPRGRWLFIRRLVIWNVSTSSVDWYE